MADTQSVGEFLRGNISEIIATLDEHEAGIYKDREPRIFRCQCGYIAPEAEWEQHLAERLAAKFTEQLVML